MWITLIYRKPNFKERIVSFLDVVEVLSFCLLFKIKLYLPLLPLALREEEGWVIDPRIHFLVWMLWNFYSLLLQAEK